MVFNFWEEINYFGKGERFLKKGTKFFFKREKSKCLNKIKFKKFFQKTEKPEKKTETPQKKEETPQQNKV